MSVVYLIDQGAMVRKSGRRLIVSKGGQELRVIRTFRLEQMVIVGNISLTTPAINLLLGSNVETIFVSTTGKYRGRLQTAFSKNIPLRQQQFRRGDQPAFKLKIGKAIVSGKLYNMRVLLMRRRRTKGVDEVTKAIHKIREMSEGVDSAESLEQLRGIEGTATRIYFAGLRKLFTYDMGFEDRNRRPPKDPINVLLSFGYTLLASSVESAINIVGLDSYMGFFHELHYGRPSLALDLMEEFRSIIVDSLVLYLVNSRIITEDNFEKGENEERPIILKDEGVKKLVKQYQNRINTKITYPLTEEKVMYRRCFELQARLIAKAIQDDNVNYQPMKFR